MVGGGAAAGYAHIGALCSIKARCAEHAYSKSLNVFCAADSCGRRWISASMQVHHSCHGMYGHEVGYGMCYMLQNKGRITPTPR